MVSVTENVKHAKHKVTLLKNIYSNCCNIAERNCNVLPNNFSNSLR